MKSTLNLQQFKALSLVTSLLALMLAVTGRASAAGSGNAPNSIKDTNYPIPTGAYFVSPDGKANNSGKAVNSPWPVDKALTSAPSGSTIVFRGGTYRNVGATLNKKLTLQAYPHEKAWIKGSVVVTGWVAEGGKWRKDGWKHSFPSNMPSSFIDPKYPLAGRRDMAYIDGVRLKQVGSKAAVKAGTFYVDAANDKLYIGSNPAGKTVEATALAKAFGIWKTASSTVVRGLGFAHYADHAFLIGGSNVTLENNNIVWNGVQGVAMNGTGATVRGNNISYNGRIGVGGVGNSILLEGNTISHNNVEHFSKTWGGAGVKLVNTNGPVWRNNLVENNLGIGMWLDVSCSNAQIVNNIVRSNGRVGIMFEISNKAIIASNLVHHHEIAGIMVYNASNAKIYNNTLAKNRADILLTDTKRNNTKAKEVAAGITWIMRKNVIVNNILSNTTGGALLYNPNCSTKEASKLLISTLNNNAYYRNSSSNPGTLITWSLGAGKCSVGYSSLAAFKSATGYEANGLAIDNVATNPFFVNEAAGDYRLKAGSIANGKGAPLPADVAKAIGVASGVKVDLGAFQSKVTLVQ